MNKFICILFLLVALTGCRTIKNIQLDRLKSLTHLQLDSIATDSGVEYSEIERTYYFNDADKNETSFHDKPASKITEKIKTLKKTDIKVQVKKDLKQEIDSKTKTSTKDKQVGKLDISVIIILVLVVGMWLYFKLRN